MNLPTEDVAKTYKGLWRVERTFREQKSTLEMRPLFHHCDEARIGHIVGSFLALRLEVDIQKRIEEKGCDVPWPNLMRDLTDLKAVHITLDGLQYRVRTNLEGFATTPSSPQESESLPVYPCSPIQTRNRRQMDNVVPRTPVALETY